MAEIDPTRTSGGIACCSGEVDFSPYQSTRLSRYDAASWALGASMRRREFITVLAGAAVSPLTARAQQAMPLVGYLNSGAATPMAGLVKAFHEGLSQAGYVENRNVAIEYRWSEG